MTSNTFKNLALTLLLGVAEVDAEPHATVPKANQNEACDDIAGNFCKSAVKKDVLAEAEKLSEEIRQTITESINSVYGAGPEEVVKRGLAKAGLTLKDDLTPEEVSAILVPYYLNNSGEGRGESSSSDYDKSIKEFEICKRETKSQYKDQAERAEVAAEAAKTLAEVEKRIRSAFTDELPPAYLLMEPFSVSSGETHKQSKARNEEARKMHPEREQLRIQMLRYFDDWGRSAEVNENFKSSLLAWTREKRARKNADKINNKVFEKLTSQLRELTELEALCSIASQVGIAWEIKEGDTNFCNTSYPLKTNYPFFGEDRLREFHEVELKTANSTIRSAIEKKLSTEFSSAPARLKKISVKKDSLIYELSDSNPVLETMAKEFHKRSRSSERFTEEDAKAYVSAFVRAQTEDAGFSDSVKTKWQQEIMTQLHPESVNQLHAMCQVLSVMYSARINGIKEKVFNNIQKTRPVVEQVTKKLYTPEVLKLQRDIFSDVLHRTQDVMEKTLLADVKDEEKKHKIRRSIKSVRAYEPAPMDKIPFVKDKETGLLVLDNEELGKGEFHFQWFEDPSLSMFSEVNAFFSPEVVYGEEKVDKGLYIFPGLLLNLRHSPTGIYQIVAHEVGHNLDPEVSRLNGYDLRSEWKGVLECLAKKDSVQMGKHQHGECIADWLAAEVVSSYIKNPPSPPIASFPTDKKTLALEAIAPFCGFGADKVDDRLGVHPGLRKRINGILAAHPVVREALGCPAKGPYPYCEYKAEQAKGAKQ